MTMVSVNALSRALDLNLVCDLVDVIALNVAILCAVHIPYRLTLEHFQVFWPGEFKVPHSVYK